MTPLPWTGFVAGLRLGMASLLWGPDQRTGASTRRKPIRTGYTLSGAPTVEPPWSEPTPPWEEVARERRASLICLLGILTAMMSLAMASVEGNSAPWPMRCVHLILFAALFMWVGAGSLTAVFGFLSSLRGDRYALSWGAVSRQPISDRARTAIVMPVRNEDVATVFGGIQAMCLSLSECDARTLFDLYVLSDTDDADMRTAEVAALHRVRASIAVHAPDLAARIHYRWRQRRARRKPGNVADFCRRFGWAYRYMIVLDADSIMSGEALAGLVRLMEAHPRAGIIQSVPQPLGQDTLHAKAQQLAAQVTGKLFALGMQYWQLGESHYWGHNAIIRVQPFMRHCALAPLPGQHSLGGDILSHDFVEAALMGRAGLEVWMVSDLPDSYEQPPSNFAEELRRDRRWCHGNLKNIRLLTEPGLRPAHRTMLLTAVMAYVSAPLWLAFITSGVLLTCYEPQVTQATTHGINAGLWGVMLSMLFLPRVLGVLAILLRQEQAAFGGVMPLIIGVLQEAVLSALQAPIRMLAHTVFVLKSLAGWTIQWRSPPRQVSLVTWQEASRLLGPFILPVMLVGAVLLTGGIAVTWFIGLICVPCLLTIPMTVWSSRRLPTESRWRWPGASVLGHAGTPHIMAKAQAIAQHVEPSPKWVDALHDLDLFAQIKAVGSHTRVRHGACGVARTRWLAMAWKMGVEHLSNMQRLRLLDEPDQLWMLHEVFAASRRPHMES